MKYALGVALVSLRRMPWALAPRNVRFVSSDALASPGDTVKVHYRGMLVDGRVFQNTVKADSGPVSFTIGENKIISGLENAVLNMRVGEKKTAELPCEDAFGQIRPEVRLSVCMVRLVFDYCTAGQRSITARLFLLMDVRRGFPSCFLAQLILFIPSTKIPQETFSQIKIGLYSPVPFPSCRIATLQARNADRHLLSTQAKW